MKLSEELVAAGALALAAIGLDVGARRRPRRSRSASSTCRSAAPISSAWTRPSRTKPRPIPNITVLSTDAEGDVAKLTSNVEDLLSQKVDGLIVSGAWIEAAPEALDAIKAAGVPVVLVDRMLKGGDFTSWIGPDNYAIGVGIGKYIVERLGGKGLVVVLRGGPADNSIGLDRTDGMLSAVEKAGIKVEKAPDFGGWSVDGGFKLMEDMLDQESQDRRRLLRERLDVPGRAEGDQGCRPQRTRCSSPRSTARRARSRRS